MLHHKKRFQPPRLGRGSGAAALGRGRTGSARCADERMWMMASCKLLANREFKGARPRPAAAAAAPGRAAAAGNPANLGAGCSPPPHARSGKPCPQPRPGAGQRQSRRTKQIVPAGQRQPAPAARRSPIQAHYSQTGPNPDHGAYGRIFLDRPGSWPNTQRDIDSGVARVRISGVVIRPAISRNRGAGAGCGGAQGRRLARTGLLADAAVDPLAEQIGVAEVACVLLDHVEYHLAQRDGRAVSHRAADGEVG